MPMLSDNVITNRGGCCNHQGGGGNGSHCRFSPVIFVTLCPPLSQNASYLQSETTQDCRLQSVCSTLVASLEVDDLRDACKTS